jgi:protein-tyrosine phosphatase
VWQTRNIFLRRKCALCTLVPTVSGYEQFQRNNAFPFFGAIAAASLVGTCGLSIALCEGQEKSHVGREPTYKKIARLEERIGRLEKMKSNSRLSTIKNAAVARLAKDTYQITWDVSSAKRAAHSVVHVSCMSHGNTLVEDVVKVEAYKGNATIQVPGLKESARPTFVLSICDDKNTFCELHRHFVCERHIQLHCHTNFRDVGGYIGKDGRVVRWGQIFRHGALTKITEDDREKLDVLGIKSNVDFRKEADVQKDCHVFPATSVKLFNFPIDTDAGFMTKLVEGMKNGNFDFMDEQFMARENDRFVREFTNAFRDFIHTAMDSSNRPLTFQCTAGKDRTGWAGAILLMILGVPKEEVFEDYLLTNKYAEPWRKHTLEWLEVSTKKFGHEHVDTSPANNALRAEAHYLQAAFDAVEKQYGDFDTFVRIGLGVSDEMKARFQEEMLYPSRN